MQKKIIFLLITAMLFSFSGCGKKVESDDGEPLPKKVSPKVETQEKVEKKAETGWTSDLEVIYKTSNCYDLAEFEETCNVNGKKYKVDITLDDEQDGVYSSAILSINDASCKIEDESFFGLYYVALAELEGEDIILFTGYLSYNDWTPLVTCIYDGKDLEPLATGVDYDGGDDVCIGFSPEKGIELTDYSDFKMWVRTSSRAMWEIEKTFTVREDRIVTQQEDRYKVNIKEFLKPYYSYEEFIEWHDISREEYDKLNEGYVMCHDDYAGMKEGTYFTVLYDDERDNIYIKTDNGEEFWAEIPEYSDGQEIAPLLFYMAG